jgi:hypothetical protein
MNWNNRIAYNQIIAMSDINKLVEQIDVGSKRYTVFTKGSLKYCQKAG